MTYLREVISIPERTGVEDDDLRLTDGVGADRVAQTLRDDVVTVPLPHAFCTEPGGVRRQRAHSTSSAR